MMIFVTILVGAGWTHTAHGGWSQVLYVSGMLEVALTRRVANPASSGLASSDDVTAA